MNAVSTNDSYEEGGKQTEEETSVLESCRHGEDPSPKTSLQQMNESLCVSVIKTDFIGTITVTKYPERDIKVNKTVCHLLPLLYGTQCHQLSLLLFPKFHLLIKFVQLHEMCRIFFKIGGWNFGKNSVIGQKGLKLYFERVYAVTSRESQYL